jgi:hypothetical protein
MHSGPAQNHAQLRQAETALRASPLAFAALLFGIVFLLRIFYASYAWADEGLWFTAANELLRGKSLYSQIWFDKPPAVAWTYAALFRVAGASLLAVRLFTIVYATAVCLALWHIGGRFWSDREGRLAAFLYAIYNATYIHSGVQPMAVDHLMLLPYLYSGYFFLTGRVFWCGLLAAPAFSLNVKAAALFLFFAAATWWCTARGSWPLVAQSGVQSPTPKVQGDHGPQATDVAAATPRTTDPSAWRWAIMLAGFVAGTAPWLAYLLTGGRWGPYVRDFWGWGFSYLTVYSPGAALLNGLRRTLNYAGFHISLIVGLGMALFLGPSRKRAGSPATSSGTASGASAGLWLWLGASFVGVAAGGRFFPRYFYQVLPLLCLLAARGYVRYTGARSKVPSPKPSGARWTLGFGLWALLFWLGIVFALVRFHHRALFLAYEKVTGRQTAYMAAWQDPAIDRDSRKIAARVHGSLFVWGYRPEIYFYCGCEAASAYLSDQPLTGVPADIHLREARSIAPGFAAENRHRLLGELTRALPDYIVDGLGPYNPALAMEQYPELRAFLDRHYRKIDEVGNGIIYARRQ